MPKVLEIVIVTVTEIVMITVMITVIVTVVVIVLAIVSNDNNVVSCLQFSLSFSLLHIRHVNICFCYNISPLHLCFIFCFLKTHHQKRQ